MLVCRKIRNFAGIKRLVLAAWSAFLINDEVINADSVALEMCIK